MPEIPATYRKIHVVNTSSLDFGEQTEIVEVPVERPGPGQVLIRIEFAGIEASDILQNSGGYGPLSDAPPAPEVNGSVQVGDCGLEGLGVVVATGEGVVIESGASVLVVGYGTSYREYVTCPATQIIPLQVPASAKMGVSTPGYGPYFSWMLQSYLAEEIERVA